MSLLKRATPSFPAARTARASAQKSCLPIGPGADVQNQSKAKPKASVGEAVENPEPSCTAGGTVPRRYCCGKHTELPHGPARPLLGVSICTRAVREEFSHHRLFVVEHGWILSGPPVCVCDLGRIEGRVLKSYLYTRVGGRFIYSGQGVGTTQMSSDR